MAERDDRARGEDSLWRAIMRVAAAVPRRLEKELHRADVALVELDVLLVLVRESPNAVRIGEIAMRTGMSFSRVSRAVGSLARRSLVERESCDVDGRGNQARITAEGRALLRTVEPELALRSTILAPEAPAKSIEFVAAYLDAVADRADSESDSDPDDAPGGRLPSSAVPRDLTPAERDPAQLLDDLVRTQIELWDAAENAARSAASIPLAWYEVLRVIDARSVGRGSDVARGLLITVGGASKLLSRVEEAGLLHREADPADARASLFSLTPEGETALRRASESVRAEVAATVEERLSPEEAEDLARLLDRFRRRPGVERCE